MNVTANVTRSGRWWVVEVPEVEGAFTQARRLEEVPEMVADAVALLEEVDPGDVSVTMNFDIGDPDALAAAREARAQVAAAAQAQEDAARASRAAIERLRRKGLSGRDVGVILKISPQRVAQLSPGRRTARAGAGPPS